MDLAGCEEPLPEGLQLDAVGPFPILRCPLVDVDPDAEYLVHAVVTGFRPAPEERPHLPALLVESVDVLVSLLGKEAPRGD
jgi:hypothetical protein